VKAIGDLLLSGDEHDVKLRAPRLDAAPERINLADCLMENRL
jgi:hypothetical protein